MESASVPESHDPKPDDPNPDDPMPDEPKPDDPQGPQRADGELTRAYERIKSANEELARLDRLVSGLERGDSPPPPAPPVDAGAERADAPPDKAPPPQSNVRPQGLKADRPMLRAFVGLLLAIGVLGAAFASQYRDEAKAIMARWAPPASNPPPEVSDVRSPAQPPAVQLAAADEPTSVPAPPVPRESEKQANKEAQKQAESAPPAAATPPDQASAELTQSLKTITQSLANINDKLEQLKNSHEQTLREQADAIQQLKTAQEKDAGDNARLAAQVQALQAQLAASSAKPAARTVMKENDTAARQHIAAPAPRRPRPPREHWMPPPYMMDPYGYPEW